MAGYHIPSANRRPANDVVENAALLSEERYATADIDHRTGTSRVEADVIALNQIIGRPIRQPNTVLKVPRNDVARRGRRSADGVVGGIERVDPEPVVTQRRRPRDV